MVRIIGFSFGAPDSPCGRLIVEMKDDTRQFRTAVKDAETLAIRLRDDYRFDKQQVVVALSQLIGYLRNVIKEFTAEKQAELGVADLMASARRTLDELY